MRNWHLLISNLSDNSSPARFITTQLQEVGPCDEQMKGWASLVNSVPLFSGENRFLEAYAIMKGWGKPQTNQPQWRWTYWHKCICYSWHLSLSFHHSIELWVENTFPEKLFFSCTFVVKQDNYWEENVKNRRWKGQPFTITASSAPVPPLNWTHNAPLWHDTGDTCQSTIEETWAETPSSNLQSHDRSTMEAY